jgi:hypothetical protein
MKRHQNEREEHISRTANDGLRSRKAGPVPAKNKYDRGRLKKEIEDMLMDIEEEV